MLLREEGIYLKKNGCVDLKKYQWEMREEDTEVFLESDGIKDTE